MEQKNKRRWPWILVAAAALIVAALLVCRYLIRPGDLPVLFRYGIWTLHSPVDQDRDGIDDYADIVLGARAYINTHPEYDPTCYLDGYPPDDRGVCTDVIWRALRAAGYDFKSMIDADIAENPDAYPLTDGKPAPDIDFRRVNILLAYFTRHCPSLTTDTTDVRAWQPGDIVVFEGHVGVVSDKRGEDGRPYIIHHAGYGAFEEDALDYKPIVGHFRWRLSENH